MATREEELQKKREEAERKARRGEIDPTHDFTIQVSFRAFVDVKIQKRFLCFQKIKCFKPSTYFRSWPS